MIPNFDHNSCRFCFPPDSERILYWGKDFYIMLSLGPIVEGYLLLISQKHVDCCANVPIESIAEFDYLMARIREVLMAEYGACIFYEHGRTGSCLREEGSFTHCYHAHMHCVPVDVNLAELVAKDLTNRHVENLNEFRAFAHQCPHPYLFVDSGEKALFPVDIEIRPQFLRYKLAQQIAVEHLADWFLLPGFDIIKAGRRRLLPHFARLRTQKSEMP